MVRHGSSDSERGDVRIALLDVAHRTQTRFGAADGVGVTLMVGRQPVFMASNEFTEAVDEVQYGLGDGPCVAAVRTRTVVSSGRIGAGELRWPDFAARTAALGLRSVLSAPVLSGGEAIGSLNLYARTHGGFHAADTASIEDMATSMADDLGTLHLLAVADTTAGGLDSALLARQDVEIAVGILMDRYTLSPAQARLLLSQLARQNGVENAAAARSLFHEDGAPS